MTLPALERDATERLQRVAVRRRTRSLVVGAALVVVTLAVVVVNLSVGDLPIPFGQVLATLVGRGDETSTLVLVEFRLPRLVLGALVGVSFGLAGGLFQSVLHNPLASPDIIGVTQGASVGAVGALLVLGLGGAAVAVGALVGAAACPGTGSCCAGSGWRSSRPACSATCSPAATCATPRRRWSG